MLSDKHNQPYSKMVHWLRCILNFFLLLSSIRYLRGCDSSIHYDPAGPLTEIHSILLVVKTGSKLVYIIWYELSPLPSFEISFLDLFVYIKNTHWHAYTSMNTHIHSPTHNFTRTHTHTHTHTNTYTHTHKHTHPRKKNAPSQIRMYTHTRRTHTHEHKHIHDYTRRQTHTYKRTHTRTHVLTNKKNRHPLKHACTHAHALTNTLYSREPAVLFRVCASACESWRGEGRKSEKTSQDLVARAQDSEQTNQISVTRKLHVN